MPNLSSTVAAAPGVNRYKKRWYDHAANLLARLLWLASWLTIMAMVLIGSGLAAHLVVKLILAGWQTL